MRYGPILATVLVVLTTHGDTTAADEAKLAAQVRTLLNDRCHGCHGQGGTAKGGFGFVLDRDKLVQQQKIVPGKAEQSELWQRIDKGEMPPADKKPPLTGAERKLVQSWIDSGAPWPTSDTPRAFLGETELQQLLDRDRLQFPARQRSLLRYVSFAHLGNAGASAADLQTARQALSKLLNSLSWHPRVRIPTAVDPHGLVYRIDLRDYQWTARQWERLVNVYPYRRAASAEATVLRGDWLIATASRAPLYYDLLELPATDRALERLLRVDVLQNIEQETAARAGFNGSGVSKNNRLLERHYASHGAYWRSYDFSDNTARQNLFDYPLGPVKGSTSFKPAGGEIIFHLPNGLHAYMLVDADGRRINKGPVEIVSDPKRPDRAVEAGLSCMTCHAPGLLPKDDQIRAHVEKNARAFRTEDREAIRALYPAPTVLRKLLDEDNARFLTATKQAGVEIGDSEPVSTMTLRFEGVLDLPQAAAELGLTAAEFLTRLRRSPNLQRIVGTLEAKRGTVQRQVFEEAFPRLLRDLDLETIPPATETGKPAPFLGHRGPITALSWAPVGGRIATGGDDETVRVWQLDGQSQHILKGHRGEILALAWSADGKTLASAGVDRVIRLWDVVNGKELARLEGHSDKVRALAFAPDGKTLASGGDDRVVRLWDVANHKERTACSGHEGNILCLAYSRDGKRLLSGSSDRSVRLWENAKGRNKGVWLGHERPVYSVAFAPNGKRAVSASAEGVLLVWNSSTGEKEATLRGHRNTVVALTWTADGVIHSGSSQHETEDAVIRLWNVADGTLRSAHDIKGKVWTVSFSPDGYAALLAGPESGVKEWRAPEKNSSR